MMVIDKPITIIGSNGTVLDAEKKSGIFDISSYDVTLKNITFVNGSAVDGGAIYVHENSNNIKISDSSFSNNTASNDGGAVYIARDTFAITFNNVNFTDNEAGRGGGAVKSWSNGNDLTFNNCTLLRNEAYGNGSNDHELGGGGIWCYNGITYITNCTFIDNWGNYGGALRGATDIKDSYFERNVAFNGNGGALDMTIEGSVKPELYIEDTKFVNNTASDYFPEGHNYTDLEAVSQGGAVHVYDIDKVEMYGCELYNNTAKYRGGGLDFYILREGYVENCTFENNTAIVGGGAYIWGDPDHLTSFKCNFTNVTANHNSARDEAGAFYIKGDNVHFHDVASDYNNATIAGSTYIEGNNVKIHDSEFNNNLAIGTCDDEYSPEFDKVGIAGAIYIAGDNAELIGVISDDNEANRGGSTFIRGSDTLIQDSHFDNNHASYRGGGLNIGGDDCTVINVTASNNNADHFGAGIYIIGDNAYVEKSTVYNNTAPNGGGIYIDGDICTIFNNTITYNRAFDPLDGAVQNGGGIAIANIFASKVNITNNNISSNYAGDNGGGLFVFVLDADIYLDNITGFNNTAENGGFCHVMMCNNLYVTNVTCDSNHATGVIEQNRGEGGAFHISNTEHAYIQGNFSNNTAVNGSAIYSQGSTLKVYDTRFFDNQAHSYYLTVIPKDNETYQLGEDVDVIIRHIGGDNVVNAIHMRGNDNVDITLKNVTYPFYNNGKLENRTTPNNDTTPVLGYQNSNDGEKLYLDDLEDNQVIYYKVLNDNDDVVAVGSDKTDISGSIKLNLKDLPVGNYRILATYEETTYYTEIRDVGSFRIVSDYNLNVRKIALNKTVYVGEQTIFTIIVNNTGENTLGNVYVVENVPAGLIYDGYTNVTGEWNVVKINDTAYNFTLVGDLAKGVSASFNVIFNTTTNGTFTNVVVAGSNVTENKTAENDTTVLGPDMTVVKQALNVVKQALNTTVYVGEQTEFLIVVNNTGDCSLGNVTVVDNVPAGLIFADYANVTGSWDIEQINATAYRFKLVGVLAEDGIASFKVIFNTTVAGTFTNVVVAGSNVTENKTAENMILVIRMV